MTQPLANSFVDLDGELKVESATFGWFQKINLKNVELLDQEKNSVASIGSIASEKSLLGIALSGGSDLGKFIIDRVDANVVTRSGGSNIEDVLAPMMESPEEETSNELPRMKLALTNGTVNLSSANFPEPKTLFVSTCDAEISPGVTANIAIATDADASPN